MKRIIDENLERVRHILGERRQALEAVTKALMEQETIDSDQLKRHHGRNVARRPHRPRHGGRAEAAELDRAMTEDAAKEKDAGGAL